jgi:hypothetical protein
MSKFGKMMGYFDSRSLNLYVEHPRLDNVGRHHAGSLVRLIITMQVWEARSATIDDVLNPQLWPFCEKQKQQMVERKMRPDHELGKVEPKEFRDLNQFKLNADGSDAPRLGESWTI